MAYDETLAERIRDVLAPEPGITEKKMFGGLCFLHRGNMVCGVLHDDLMARVGKDAHEEALSRPHARPMDFTHRPSKGIVFVSAAGTEDDESLAGWVARCLAFTRTLPAK